MRVFLSYQEHSDAEQQKEHVLWGTMTNLNSIWLEVGSCRRVACEGLVNQIKEKGFYFMNAEEALKSFKQECPVIRFAFYDCGEWIKE